MDSASVSAFALGAVLVGSAMLLLVYLSARCIERRRTRATPPASVSLAAVEGYAGAGNGVVVARQGGRVLFANEQARKLFALNGGKPNLSRMARMAEPQSAFYELFAAPGQARLTVSNRPVEATSIALPNADPPQYVIVLREAERLAALAGGGVQREPALQGVAELSRLLSATLDLPQTLDNILRAVRRVLEYDLGEIWLWDEAALRLHTGRHAGEKVYEVALNRLGAEYDPNGGPAGWIARNRGRLLVSGGEHDELFPQAFAEFPLRSHLGAPLLHEEQLVGTLHISSREAEAYGEGEAALLETLAGPAVLALRNAQRFTQQQAQVEELAGLIQVAQTSALVSDTHELHTRLTNRIASLMEVAFCGILLYSAEERALVPQLPFHGVPELFIDTFHIPLPPDSPAEKLWQEREYWYSNNVEADPLADALGLKQLGAAFSITSVMLVPLVVGGRHIGAIQAANKISGEAFGEADARRLSEFARQAAALIDNAQLVRAAEMRARRAEGEHRIADHAGSRLSLDEILTQIVGEAVNLFEADFGLVLLLDESRQRLAAHGPSAFDRAAGAPITPQALEEAGLARIDTAHPEFKKTVTASLRPFHTGQASLDEAMPGLYRPAHTYLQAESTLLAPLIIRGGGMGEIWIGTRRPFGLYQSDLPALATIAAHLANAIERSRLSAATDETLRRRVEQLSALSRVSRELNRTLELEHILQAVYDEAVRASGAVSGSIALLDVEAEAPRLLRRLGEVDAPTELSALEREVALAGEGRIVHDFALQELQPPYLEARSALIAPIAYQDRTVGLINLHSPQPNGFDDSMLEFTQALAGHAAIAVGNAQRYEEQMKRGELLRRRADQLAQLLQISRSIRSDRPLDETLEAIAYGIQEAVGFNVVTIGILEAESNLLRFDVAAGLPLALIARMQAEPQPWGPFLEVLRDEFRISHSHYVPHDQRPEALAGSAHFGTSRPDQAGEPGGWRAGDLLVVQLVGSGGQTLGVVTLDDPRSRQAPDTPTVETIEIFANQAALAIENARLFEAAEQRAAELAQSLATVRESYRELDEASQSLQRKDQEMSQLVQRLDVRNARLLALHRISAAIIGLADPDALLQTVAEQLHQLMEVDVSLLVRASADGTQAGVVLDVAGVSGDISGEVNLGAVLAAENVLLHVLAEQEPLFVRGAGLSQWADDPLVTALQLHSFIVVPLRIEGRVGGALLAGSQSSPSPFSAEDVDLFTILAQQVGIVLQNARLQTNVRERAAQLQALTEVSHVISSALRVEDVVSLVLEQVGSVIPFDSATLWLREGDFLRVAATTGFADDEKRLGLAVEVDDSRLYTEMAQTQQPILVPDVRADARFPGSEISPTRSWLGMPLSSKGQVLGLLALDKKEADFYHAGHVELARGFANQAAVALDNARLFEESVQRAIQLNERTQRLQLLNRLSGELGRSLDMGHVMSVAIEQIAQAAAVEQAGIYLFDEEFRTGRLAAEYPVKLHPPFEVTIPLQDNPAIEHIRETHAPIAIVDVVSDPLAAPLRRILLDREVKSILIVPLIAGGRVMGMIGLEELEGRRRFRAGEIELAQTIANQAAIAVQNARLYEQAQQRLIELEIINHISRSITATMDLQQLMATLRQQITSLLHTENVYVALYDAADDEVTLTLQQEDGEGLRFERRPVGGLTEKIIRARQPLLLSGKLELGEADPGPEDALAKRLARSYFGLPLLAGDKVVGVLTVLDFQRYDAFTHAHERILTTLAAQVAVAIENARLFGEVQAATEELERRVAARTRDVEHERDRVETLLRMTSELSASLDLDSVLTHALTLVNDAVHASQGSLFLIDTQSGKLAYRAALGGATPLPPGGAPAPFKPGEGLVGWVMENRQTVVVDDLEKDARWLQGPHSEQHKSALAAPVVSGEDVLGALIFYSDRREAFDAEQLRLATAAANQVASAVNNSELYRLIRDQAERLGGMLRAQQVEASKVRAILEAVADGVLVSDQTGTIILFNRSAELILQLERTEVLGHPASEFIGIYGAAGQSWLNAIERWSGNPDAYRPGDFLAERLELEDKRIISVHLAPVINNDEFIGSVSLFRDITRDVEVDRLKTEFVTTVSHELRTPMTSIKGYADLLLMGAGGSLDAQQRQFMEMIKANADRLKLLVEDLLDISKIEAGKIELNMQRLDLRAVLRQVVEHLQGAISEGGKAMEVAHELPASLLPVMGDEVRLAQIFRNLVDNAYTYTPEGGKITLRAATRSGTVQVDVQDSGIGVSQEERARIFERFYRGEDPLVLASAGTGLGLNIVQRLVEMHGGHLWVESEGRGKGSTFSVLLPAANVPPSGDDNASIGQETGPSGEQPSHDQQ